MKRISMLVILGLLVWAGLYLRFIDLGQKPMHTDEAVNGVMVYQTLSGQSVTFDPSHYHGPLLRYVAVPVAWISQRMNDGSFSEVSLRWTTALAGGLTVLILILFRNLMGKDACFIALVFTAVSPPLIYYSRYFIHESVFVLGSLGFLLVFWQFMQKRNWAWAIYTGILVGILHAIRETVVLVLLAAALAIIVSAGREWRDQIRWVFSRDGLSRIGLGFLAGLVVSVFFYSGFFTHWQGPVDSLMTYFRYETEAGHEKPWYYYLGLILGERSRVGYLGQCWLLVFGLAGIWQASTEDPYESERKPFFRFVAVYTITTTILYSVIAYKTPWLMLNFLVGWILLSGLGWVYLWSRLRYIATRILLVVLLVASLGHSVKQSWMLGFRYSADPRNPFVYSHTSPDMLNLVHRLEVLSSLHPDGKAMRIDIAGTEYWPFPWYLREYSRVGYWPELPMDSDAPVKILSFTADQDVPDIDETIYMTELRGLREGVFLLAIIENSLWESQFPE